MKRLFFALDINAADKAIIANWRSQLAISAKPVLPENFHITLAFLGQVTSEVEQQLIQHINQTSTQGFSKSYNLQLKNLGLFKKPQVLYLAFESFPVQLVNIANTLKQLALSHQIPQETRDYLPHITLFRKAKTLPNITPLQHTLNVNSFSLYHSKSTPAGVQYQAIATWPTMASLNS